MSNLFPSVTDGFVFLFLLGDEGLPSVLVARLFGFNGGYSLAIV